MSRLLVPACLIVMALSSVAEADAQSATGPIKPKALTVESYEKVLTGLIANGSGDRLWQSLSPDAQKQLVDKVFALQNDPTIQMPVGPVTPKPPVTPPKPKPNPNPLPGITPPTAPPSKAAFDDSLSALTGTLKRVAAADPGYVLPPQVDARLQELVGSLSNVKSPSAPLAVKPNQ
jgi:hypothetical protein